MEPGSLSRKEQVIRKAAELFRGERLMLPFHARPGPVTGIEAASLYSHIKSKEEILVKPVF